MTFCIGGCIDRYIARKPIFPIEWEFLCLVMEVEVEVKCF